MSSCDLWGRRKTGPRDVRVQLIELPFSAYTEKRVYPKALHKTSFDPVLGLITQIWTWFRVKGTTTQLW
jgi:hypothetical protein